MKTAILFIRRVLEDFNANYYQTAVNALENGGVRADTIAVIDHADDIGFKRNLHEIKDTFDNLIIFGADLVKFNLKEIIAEVGETVLVENESAKGFLDAVRNLGGREYPDEYALLPLEAVPIPNVIGGFQGFILSANQDFSVTVLPSAVEEFKPMCDKYLLPYLENRHELKVNRITLKYFGDEKNAQSVIDNIKQIHGDIFESRITSLYGDCTINLFAKDTTAQTFKDVVRQVLINLKDGVYAEFETSLSERLFDLLKLKNLKISFAESFTGGRVASSVISNSGASQFVNEGIVSYSNESKVSRLKVNNLDLIKEGAVSSKVAYQMARGLIMDKGCDVAISTTGIAGPKSDDTKKPVGLCYIAIGMKDGVHTYRFNFTGDRENITETAKNTALFLAIKILKNK